MISRRRLLQTAAGMLLIPDVPAATPGQGPLSWQQFARRMADLADAKAGGQIASDHLARTGINLLQRLDAESPGFAAALGDSWESGNRFWLWQRLTGNPGLLGGVLTVERDNAVPLHDHPGATGMLRILDGELELWQFDMQETVPAGQDGARVTLQRVTHRILGPGDTAILAPESGNIHALRSISRKCRMLDYFIPPYDRTRRTWYSPLQDDWENGTHITCRRTSEQDFYAG